MFEKAKEQATKEQIKAEISSFIQENTNELGIDISKLYFAALSRCYGSDSYNKYSVNETNNPNEIAIVYVREIYRELNNVYIDIFNETLLEDSELIIPGVLSMLPMWKRGVVVSRKYRLDEVLGVERLPYESLELIFNKLKKVDTKTIVELSNEELVDYCNDNESEPIIK